MALNAKANPNYVPKRINGKFAPGWSGNPGGSLEATRRSFNKDFLLALAADFKKHGAAAIEKVRKTQPAAYMKICALLVPREMKVEHSNAIKDLTDEQLEAMIEYLKASLEAKAQGTNVTGGEVLDAAALPAPETTGPAPDVVLDDKPKQPNKVMEAANTAIGPMRALRTTRAPSTLREILEAEK